MARWGSVLICRRCPKSAGELSWTDNISLVAPQPVSILSYRVDPDGVLSLVRQLAPDARARVDETTWRTLEVPPSHRAHGHAAARRSALVLTHEPESYNGPRWAETVGELRDRCKGFPPTSRTAGVVRALSAVSFRLDLGPGCVVDLDEAVEDERSAIVLAIAEHLDALLLTPSSVRDRRGRVLIGDCPGDLDAALPAGASSIPTSELRAGAQPCDGSPDPSPERVALRALALAATSSRAFLEQMDPEKVDLDLEHARLRAWVEAVGLADELEPDEWRLIQTPVLWADEQAAVDAAWRLEGLTVLAWALGIVELPPYDEMVKPTELYPSLGFLDPDAGEAMTKRASLLPRADIEAVRAQLFTIRWRLREFRRTGETLDLTRAPTVSRYGALDFSGCRLIDHDLSIGRLPIDIAPEDQIKRVDDIVLERLEALTWLLEGGTYSHVTLEL